LNAQTYTQLVDITNRWNYLDEAFTTCCGGEAKTYSFFISGDTLISEVHYNKLMCKIFRYNDTSTVYTAGIREDTDKQEIFIKEKEGSEKRVFSFKHKIGATISIDTTYWRDAYTIRYVKSIDSFKFGDFAGEKIEICDTLFRINAPYTAPSESYTDYWYEGIGSLREMFGLVDVGSFEVHLELLCFWTNDDQIYQNPNWSVCIYAIKTGIEEISNISEMYLLPNPTKGEFEVRLDNKIKEIVVIDILGSIVQKQNNRYINIAKQPAGIYLVRVVTKDNQIITKKLVKSAL